MATITLRDGLGRALTHQEMDDNFTNLNNDKYESGSAVSFTNVTLTSLSGQASEATSLMIDASGVVGTRELGSLAFSSATYDNYVSWTIQDGDSTTYTVTSGDTLQIASGTEITSNFTADDVLTITHANVSRSDPSAGSDTLTHEGTFTAITGVTTNARGHVTAVQANTFTMPAGAVPNDATVTLGANTGLSGGGTFTVDQTANSTISFALDFSELTDMTADISGTTEFILQNGTTESRKAANEIKLSAFNNDLTSTAGNFDVQGSLQVSGDLTVLGNTVSVDVESLSISDNMIYLNASANSSSPVTSIDIGFAGNVNDNGSYTHTGFFRDATDDTWKVFDNYTPEPDSALEINTDHASYEEADFQAKVLKSSVANGTAPLVVASSTVVTNLNADKLDGQDGSYYLDYTNTTNKPTIGNATITISAGTELSTGGDFTTNQTGNETITINHANVTRSDPSNGTATLTYGGTFATITSVTTNARGHVTAVQANTFTMPAQYVHPNPPRTNNTSTAGPDFNGTFTAIDSITSDANGHITAVNTKTVTLPRFSIRQGTSGTSIQLNDEENISFINGTYTTAAVVNQTNPTVTFNHNNTTTVTTSNTDTLAHGDTFDAITSVGVNAQGHVTSIDSITFTLPDQYTHPTQTAINTNATNNGINVIDSISVNTLGHVTAVGTRNLSNANSTAAGVMSSSDFNKLAGIESGAQVNVATNLGTSANTSQRTVTSSTGSNVVLPAANSTQAGVMSSDDFSKLSGIESGAQVNVATNLGTSANSIQRTVTSSTGSNVSLPAANSTTAGVMTGADKSKLDGIEAGAQVNVATNLGTSANTTTRTVTSSTGSNVTLPTANSTQAGVMSSADRSKLDGIAAGAQVNVATNITVTENSANVTIASSTGSNDNIQAATTSLAGVMSAADKTKLNGIESGAQVNVATNLGTSANTTTRTVTSSTGSNVTLPTANSTQAGVMSSADRTKLDGIATGAQVNVGTNITITENATTVTVASSTGTNDSIAGATASLAGVVTNTTQTFGGSKTFNSETIINVADNQLLLHPGATQETVILRNDGSNFYLLLSDVSASPSGTWNSLRPFAINTSNGQLLSQNGQTLNGGTTVGGVLTVSNYIDADAFHEDVSVTTGGSYSVNCRIGVHWRTLNAATTISFTNTPATNKSTTVTLILKQDAIGSRNVTWPSSNWYWAENVEPPMDTSINAINVYTVQIINNGGTIYYFASLSIRNAS